MCIRDSWKYLAGKSQLFQHKNSEHKASHEKKYYDCDMCGKKFTRKHSLIQHKSCYHEGMRFNCSTCESTFT